MIRDLFESLKSFSERIQRSPNGRNALKAFNCTVQFRVVDRIPEDTPMDWYFQSDGDWYYMDIKDGDVSYGRGDVREQRDWKYCVLVHVDLETLQTILEARMTPVEALFENRLCIANSHTGTVPGAWVTTLLRLGQSVDRYGNYLHLKRQKSFMIRRYE